MKHNIYAEGYNPILYIDHIGYAVDKDSTRDGPRYRNAYIIHYVIRGKGFYNGTEVHAGQGFLTYPNVLTSYAPDEKDPWEYVWISSPDPKMTDIFSYYNAHSETLIFDYDYISDVEVFGKDILLHDATRVPSFQLLSTFMHLFSKHSSKKYTGSHSEDYMDFFTNYVENNIRMSLKISQITKLLGVSQPYLHKICKKHLGVSPKQYISDRKIFHAKKLLTESDVTVSEIAASLGFDDVFAFSHFFSLHTGTSPTAYRNK